MSDIKERLHVNIVVEDAQLEPVNKKQKLLNSQLQFQITIHQLS
jgi:hypothetical protein